MREVLFWGATGHAKVLHELIHGTDMSLVALVDNRAVPSPISDVPLLHGPQALDAWLVENGGDRHLYFAVAVGGGRGRDRLELMELLWAKGLHSVTLIHRSSFVAHTAQIGDGSHILAQSAICAHTRIGRGVIVNTSASVDHDGEIGDGVHVGPGARLAGEVKVGARSFIGTGAVVLPRITIGEDSIVGAGAVVTRDVLPGITVMGIPARRRK